MAWFTVYQVEGEAKIEEWAKDEGYSPRHCFRQNYGCSLITDARRMAKSYSLRGEGWYFVVVRESIPKVICVGQFSRVESVEAIYCNGKSVKKVGR